jgi:hypothetical protein
VKTDRWFYSAAGATFIVTMLVGFRWFVTSANGDGGREIDPVMFRLDLSTASPLRRGMCSSSLSRS